MINQVPKRILHHIIDVAVMTAIVFGVTTGIARIWAWWQFGTWLVDINTSDVDTWVVALIVLIQNVALVGYVWRRSRATVDIGWRIDRTVLIYIVVGIPLLITMNVVVGAVFALLGLRQNQAATYPLQAEDIFGQVLFGVAAAVIAPLGEEIIFRGYWLQRLRGWWGNAIAIVGSSLLFAVAHSWSATEGAMVLVTQTLVMGGVLAWLRIASGSIWPAVLAHVANNALAISVLMICLNNPTLGCAFTGNS